VSVLLGFLQNSRLIPNTSHYHDKMNGMDIVEVNVEKDLGVLIYLKFYSQSSAVVQS